MGLRVWTERARRKGGMNTLGMSGEKGPILDGRT